MEVVVGLLIVVEVILYWPRTMLQVHWRQTSGGVDGADTAEEFSDTVPADEQLFQIPDLDSDSLYLVWVNSI